MQTINLPVSQLHNYADNPRSIDENGMELLKQSITDFPEMLEAQPLIVSDRTGQYVVLGGNQRIESARQLGLESLPCIVVSGWNEDMERRAVITANAHFGNKFDPTAFINSVWADCPLDKWGVDAETLEGWGNAVETADWNGLDKEESEARHPDNSKSASPNFQETNRMITGITLQERFVVPPFSILDTRQGYWIRQKAAWKEKIQDFGESRSEVMKAKKETHSFVDLKVQGLSVSLLDPVLSEIIVKWFGLPNCKTFDCFAGDSVFGYVSTYLGNEFTGIELRQEQVDLNNERLPNKDRARYICDDGCNILSHVAENSQDLLFSCPPHFDLEVYSELENDASNQDSYEDFIKIIDTAFTYAAKCLKENRFAVIVCGDVRDQKNGGGYFRFPDHIKDIFQKNGFALVNELILIEAVGMRSLTTARSMRNRKPAKTHQNVLVFYKGNPSKVHDHFPVIEYDESQLLTDDEDEIELPV